MSPTGTGFFGLESGLGWPLIVSEQKRKSYRLQQAEWMKFGELCFNAIKKSSVFFLGKMQFSYGK